MSLLDGIALLLLLFLVLVVVAAWAGLAMLPGKIARSRNHPQADAINACGWCGGLTLGLLLPIAFVWAFSDPRWREREASISDEDLAGEDGR